MTKYVKETFEAGISEAFILLMDLGGTELSRFRLLNLQSFFARIPAPGCGFQSQKARFQKKLSVFNYSKDMSFLATAKFILTNAKGDCSQI